MFTYTPVQAPTVTGISPDNGDEAGGSEVTISGTEFVAGATVSFGGSEASDVIVHSGLSITARIPPGAGHGRRHGKDVRRHLGDRVQRSLPLRAAASRSAGSNLAAYCESIGDPGDGEGSIKLLRGEVSGPNFAFENWACVESDGNEVAIATSGPAPSEEGACLREYPGVASFGFPEDVDNAFTWGCYISQPAVSKVEPKAGPTGGGSAVTITGSALTGATAVEFGETSASFEVVSPTEIKATAPAGSGPVDVTVTTPGGATATSADDEFDFESVPSVTKVEPSEGPTTGGTPVKIIGTGFGEDATAKIGGVELIEAHVVSEKEITGKTPPGSAGPAGVVVSDAGGSSSGGPSYTYAPPSGCTESWARAESGSWNVAANWSPEKIPTSSDDVCITTAGALPYTVTLTGSASVKSLTLGATSGSSKQTLLVGGPATSGTLKLSANSAINRAGVLDLEGGSGNSTLGAPAATIENAGDLLSSAHATNFLETNLVNSAGATIDVQTGELRQDENTTTTNNGAIRSGCRRHVRRDDQQRPVRQRWVGDQRRLALADRQRLVDSERRLGEPGG